MLKTENLRNAQGYITQAQIAAKQVHDFIVVENKAVSSALMDTLVKANARAAAAHMILNSLDAVQEPGATELDRKMATVLHGMLDYLASKSVRERAPMETTLLLNEYATKLERDIYTMG